MNEMQQYLYRDYLENLSKEDFTEDGNQAALAAYEIMYSLVGDKADRYAYPAYMMSKPDYRGVTLRYMVANMFNGFKQKKIDMDISEGIDLVIDTLNNNVTGLDLLRKIHDKMEDDGYRFPKRYQMKWNADECTEYLARVVIMLCALRDIYNTMA